MQELQLFYKKNYAKFKIHFHEAQLKLKKISDPDMIQASIYYDNALVVIINYNIQD